jgi:hypothetical protein
MQPINILRNQVEGWHTPLDLCQRQMGSVGLRLERGCAPLCVPVPDRRRITFEARNGCQIFRPKMGPQPGLRIAKGGNAAFSGDARARQNRYMLSGAQLFADALEHSNYPVNAICHHLFLSFSRLISYHETNGRARLSRPVPVFSILTGAARSRILEVWNNNGLRIFSKAIITDLPCTRGERLLTWANPELIANIFRM